MQKQKNAIFVEVPNFQSLSEGVDRKLVRYCKILPSGGAKYPNDYSFKSVYIPPDTIKNFEDKFTNTLLLSDHRYNAQEGDSDVYGRCIKSFYNNNGYIDVDGVYHEADSWIWGIVHLKPEKYDSYIKTTEQYRILRDKLSDASRIKLGDSDISPAYDNLQGEKNFVHACETYDIKVYDFDVDHIALVDIGNFNGARIQNAFQKPQLNNNYMDTNKEQATFMEKMNNMLDSIINLAKGKENNSNIEDKMKNNESDMPPKEEMKNNESDMPPKEEMKNNESADIESQVRGIVEEMLSPLLEKMETLIAQLQDSNGKEEVIENEGKEKGERKNNRSTMPTNTQGISFLDTNNPFFKYSESQSVYDSPIKNKLAVSSF
jgi:hypothetical protein